MSKLEKTRNNGQWSEGRFKSFVTSALRGSYRRWPPKWAVLAKACVGKRKSKDTGRTGKHFRCSLCAGVFRQAQVQVDHIEPIGSCATWDEFIDRLFTDSDNLQVLCKKCHAKKTKKERQVNKD